MARPQISLKELLPPELISLSRSEQRARFDAMSDAEISRLCGARDRATMIAAFAQGGLDFDVDLSGIPTTKDATVRLDTVGAIAVGGVAQITVVAPSGFRAKVWEVEQDESSFEVVDAYALATPLPASELKWIELDWSVSSEGGSITVSVRNVANTPKRFASFLFGESLLTDAERQALIRR